MDRSAVGHDYVAEVPMHASQVDYRTGFGGKFGIQTDRIDKVTVSILFYHLFLAFVASALSLTVPVQ